jgi:hypothetical protein
MSMCSGPPLLCNVTRTVSPLCVPLLCNVTRTVSPLCVLILRYKTLLADVGIIILLKNYFQSTNTTCFVFCVVSGLCCTRACVRQTSRPSLVFIELSEQAIGVSSKQVSDRDIASCAAMVM